MLDYKIINDKYWLIGNNIKGMYGPFEGIYIKNRSLGIIDEKVLEKSLKSFKYSVGVTQNNIFVIGENGFEKIIKK